MFRDRGTQQGIDSELHRIYVIQQGRELPHCESFSQEVITTIKEILPDYTGDEPSIEPEIFFPKSFSHLVARREEVRNGSIVISRNIEEARRYQIFLTNLRENGIDVNDHVRNTIVGSNAYILVPDQFPANTPADILHGNLWFKDDPDDQDIVAATVAQCLVSLGKPPSDVILAEKKKKARMIKTAFIAGNTPSVPGIRHLHLFIRQNISNH